jgi:hypothetical protein
MEVEFAFRREGSDLFGSIWRPVARVTVIHRRRRVPQLFYVDSGADVTLLPKSVGNLLGLTLVSPQEIQEIKGIGERGVPIVIRRLKLQVGSRVFPVRSPGAFSKKCLYYSAGWIASASSTSRSVMI